MSHGNSTLARLARPQAKRAIVGLIEVLEDRWNAPAARVAAARALLEFGYGPRTRRPIAKPAAAPVEKLVKVEWAEPTK